MPSRNRRSSNGHQLVEQTESNTRASLSMQNFAMHAACKVYPGEGGGERGEGCNSAFISPYKINLRHSPLYVASYASEVLVQYVSMTPMVGSQGVCLAYKRNDISLNK